MLAGAANNDPSGATIPTLQLFREGPVVSFTAQSSIPVNMDVDSWTYEPDRYAVPTGSDAGTIAATMTAAEAPVGYWDMYPARTGPFGPAGAPTEPVTLGASALMQPFDADATNATATYAPVTIAPGATGTLHVTLKPMAADVGNKVSGVIYIDVYDVNDGYGVGEELAALPYRYKVTK